MSDRDLTPLFPTRAESLAPLVRRALEPPPESSRNRASDLAMCEIIVGTARHHVLSTTGERSFVLQLSCSFLPGPACKVVWARFRVRVSSDLPNATPIAVDLAPREAYEELETELNVTIEPKLAFESLNVSLGSAHRLVQKTTQIPVTIEAGLQTNTVFWQLESTDKNPIAGVREFYALFQAPAGCDTVKIESGAVADVSTGSGVFRLATRQRKETDSIVQTVSLNAV